MKTKDLIELLRNADPTGEGYIMLDEYDVPLFLEYKIGYWDGAYSYLDETGRMVVSTKDSKFDLYCKGVEDVVWDDLDGKVDAERFKCVESDTPFHFDKDHWWERLKEAFKFDSSVTDDMKAKLLKKAEELYDRWVSYRRESDAEWEERTLKEHADGIRFFQAKEVDQHGYRHFFSEPDPHKGRGGLCSGTISVLLYSGLFKKLELEDRTEFVLK